MNIRKRPGATAALHSLGLTGLALPAAAGSHAPKPKTTTGGTTTTTTTTTSGGGTTKPGGGPGGPGGGVVSGAITAIDTSAGTITVTPTGGTASVITLTTSTAITGHKAIAATAIAVGDTLDVTGVPLTAQASGIVDRGAVTASSSSTGSSSGTGGPSPADGGAAPVPGLLRFTGVVTENDTTALIVSVDNSFSVTLTPASGVKLSALVPVTASQMAVGDAVNVQVTASKSGTLTAIRVDDTPTS